MTRWAAGIEYCGTDFAGWQIQEHSPSVQQAVERALSSVAAHPVDTIAAGRTDAGVHAWNQVIHFDSEAPRPAHGWLLGANTQLPPPVAVRWVRAVDAAFDARRSARARRYRYVIHNGRARPGLLHGRVGWVIAPLDAGKMHRAAQALIGEHDFSAFRDSECQSRSPMRNVHAIEVRRVDAYIVLDVKANAFLHHMVRNITGVLVAIGEGKRPESWTAEVLATRQRTRAGVTAEADGLYFVGPEYPETFALPSAPVTVFPA